MESKMTEGTVQIIDNSPLTALLTAINCAGFAEGLLRSAQQNFSQPDLAPAARSYLEEARDILRAATQNVEAALRKLPPPAPPDPAEPKGDPNEADREWSAR
jgi:hypothetical protein